jgi:spore coat protein A
VDALLRPRVLSPSGTVDGAPYYEIAARQITQQLHADFPPTTLWGYAGGYPGPTIEARRDRRIFVRWKNELPDGPHLLDAAYDTHLHGARDGEPRVRIVTHLHGGHVPPSADGHPTEWITPGGSALFEYPNLQPAATLWYHDHVLGITRLNVYAGLAGFYLIRDDVEDRLDLPAGAYEVPLAIQDRSLNADGSLLYPQRDPRVIPTGPNHPGPWVPEAFGDIILVNGKAWPYLEVEPRKYRLRLLNGSNSRFYHLSLAGLPFLQIGSDGGLLESPVQLSSLLLAPGERADVLVDFRGVAGRGLVMTNDAPDGPFSGALDPADRADPERTGTIMEFRIAPTAVGDTPALPAVLTGVERLSPQAAVVRDFTLTEGLDEADEPTELLISGSDFDDPPVASPRLGDTEVWRFINLTRDTHPMHVHLVQFQVLDRQPLGVAAHAGAFARGREGGVGQPRLEDFLTGPAVPPDENERGWKDTVRANPGEVTRIVARFDGFRGLFPMHCHILEHEDNAMMVKFEVV